MLFRVTYKQKPINASSFKKQKYIFNCNALFYKNKQFTG